MLDYVKIGSKIRSLRKAKGMSQEQLAERIWISTTHMSHIETGSTKLSLPVLVDIANALGVGADDILAEQIATRNKNSEDTIYGIINRCTVKQKEVIEKIVVAAKNAMDENP